MGVEFKIKPSKIDGVGLFTTSVQKVGTRLFKGVEWKNKRLRLHKLSKRVNHSETPNCEFEKFYDTWFITVVKKIKVNEEVTVNYNGKKTPPFIKRFKK